MKNRQRHEDAVAVETPFIETEKKKVRPLFDTDGREPVKMSLGCVLQHAAVVAVIVMLATLLGLALWYMQNDESYDYSKLENARPPW